MILHARVITCIKMRFKPRPFAGVLLYCLYSPRLLSFNPVSVWSCFIILCRLSAFQEWMIHHFFTCCCLYSACFILGSLEDPARLPVHAGVSSWESLPQIVKALKLLTCFEGVQLSRCALSTEKQKINQSFFLSINLSIKKIQKSYIIIIYIDS